MSWEKVKLGDIADFSNGINFSRESYSEGVKLISVSNFGNRFYPDYDSLEEIKEEIVKENDYLSSGEIVFVRSNGNKELVGRCMLIKHPPKKVTYSGFCIRARFKDTSKHDPVYWTYHFKDFSFRRVMSGTAVGSNIQNLSQERLSNYEALVPDIAMQKKIGNILSIYDDLIENNLRQIKLLEEAAMRLYREWFVFMRFPGHESVRIVDGVPEGWREATIGDMAEYLNGFAFKPSDWKKEGFPIIKIKELTDGITSDTPRNSGESVPDKYLVKKGDIIFSWSATLFVKIWDAEDGLLNQHLFKVTPMQNVCREFVLQSIQGALPEFYNLTTGSTMVHIQRDKLDRVKRLIPDKEIMRLYEKTSTPIREKILSLTSQIYYLQKARDALLPRLMNGGVGLKLEGEMV